ncbi:MAG: YjfB family protein [Pseudomonadota bacterium]
MDISGVQTSSLASGLDQRDNVGVNVLKKAMDIEKQTAMQLIESIPSSQSQPTGNLGNNLDVYA